MRPRRVLSPCTVAAVAVVASVAVVSSVAVDDPPVVEAASVPAGFTDAAVAAVSDVTTVESLPDGRIVVLQQDGVVRSMFPGDATLGTSLVVPGICSNGERGLLGFTHDPGFLTNGHVYLYTTRVDASAPGGCVNRVSRFTMGGGRIDPASEVVLLDGISSVNTNHNGGDLDIGSDGYLYVAVGDAGRDPRGDSGSAGANDAAQDLSLLNGKILRITTSGEPAPGNPYTGPGTARCATRGNTPSTPTTTCQEIFASGLRNPYRFAFDPNTGSDRLFANDVGQSGSDRREEVDDIRRGGNYGWNACEGPCVPSDAAFVDPVTSYGGTYGTFITAGAFVPDGLWPESMDGGYLFADGGSGNVWLLPEGGAVDYDAPWATGAFGIVDMAFAFDEDGRLALYYVARGDGLRKITWDGQDAAPTPGDLAFESIPPTRAFDSRDATGGAPGDLRSDTTRLVELDPPDADVAAALVNITITDNDGWGFARAWAPRSLRPPTSVVNVVRPGTDVANSAVVTLDDAGRFVLSVAMGTDAIVDVQGWFRETPGTASSGRFVAVDPGRLIDTRQPAGTRLASGTTNRYVTAGSDASGVTLELPVAGEVGLPDAADVSAVAVVLTALGTDDASGFVTAYADSLPSSSNVNTGGGDVRANLAVVPLDADGDLSVRLERVDFVLVDVVGYFTAAGATTSSSGLFSVITPDRVYDERIPGSPPAPADGSLTLDLTGDLPSGSAAVLQNLTMTATTGFDFVTAYPPGAGVPEVSNVNAPTGGETRAALAITKLGGGDTVGYYTFGESALIVDVFGAFAD